MTSDVRFNEEGTDLEEYALGFRGGTGSNAINGDGPLATWYTTMRPSSERKSIFMNFEYDISPRTTAYIQANYARTDGLNRNAYTTGTYCVRFNSQGASRVLGATLSVGQTVWFGVTAPNYLTDYPVGGSPGARIDPATYPRSTAWSIANFRTWMEWSGGVMGNPASTFGMPYWILVSDANMANGSVNKYGATLTNAPTTALYSFGVNNSKATPIWQRVIFASPTVSAGNGNVYWWLIGAVLNQGFDDPGTPANLPQMGRNAYAFLNNLSPDAQSQMINAFGSGSTYGNIVDPKTGTLLTGANTTAGGSAATGLDTLYGPSACEGFTALRKVWSPQFQQYTTQVQEPWRTVAGVRGRFGGDWRWEGYVQYGKTDSRSSQNNVATNLRLAMAIDAVIDDRVGSATYGQPICRVVRDGVPVIDYQGRPVSELAELQALAANCQPINLFGNEYASSYVTPGYEAFASATYDAAAMQQAAIDYAFVESVSSGWNDLGTFNFNTSGTLMDGIGAGPLTGAFGLEISQNRTVNVGTQGTASYYERADLASAWADAFGGKTRTTEAYTELNMPLVSGQEGINLFSLNLGARYTSYYNKGGAGTTGAHATQNVFNWKFQTVYEPFEWVRLRMTRSRDQRAAGFRDLFIQQPGLPDQFAGTNPWREYNPDSDEARQERWGQIRAGNPDLKPEKSDTLTLGLVLSPGGWAQGMRFSVDYYDIRVKDAIGTPFISSTTSVIQSCWQNSADATGTLNHDPSTTDPSLSNGAIDYDFFDKSLGVYPCREIAFGTDDEGNVNLQDILNYNSARPVNQLPYQRRGLDLSLNYNFPLNRAFESLPGSVSLTLRGTRALEASGLQINSSLANTPANCTAQGGTYSDFNCYIPVNAVGQIRSSVFVPGVAASPKWSGNFSASYLMGDLTTTLSARYIGGANLDNTWCDASQAAEGCPNYQDENGNFLSGSVDNNRVKSYFNFALNGSYNLKVGNMRQFQLFGSINNLFDKSPPFTGGGISGASSQYHDIMGRSYRFGVRMRF